MFVLCVSVCVCVYAVLTVLNGFVHQAVIRNAPNWRSDVSSGEQASDKWQSVRSDYYFLGDTYVFMQNPLIGQELDWFQVTCLYCFRRKYI